jgi:hypothetical protein
MPDCASSRSPTADQSGVCSGSQAFLGKAKTAQLGQMPTECLSPDGCHGLPLPVRLRLIRRETRRLVNLLLDGNRSSERYRATDLRVAALYSCCFGQKEPPSGNVSARLHHLWTRLASSSPPPVQIAEWRAVSIPCLPVGVSRSSYVAEILEKAEEILLPAHRRGDVLTLACHGSLSTEDYTGFSDADLIAVISDECLHDYDRLGKLESDFSRLNVFIRSADPLAHHMVLVLSESDLGCYEESLLPLAEWKRASLLLGEPAQCFRLVCCRDESMRQLEHHSSKLDTAVRTPWECRLLLSRLFLIPAIYLQALHGVYLGKRSALLDAELFLPPFVLDALDAASRVRTTWSRQAPPSHLPQEILGRLPLIRRHFLAEVHRFWPVVLEAVLDGGEH